MSFVYDNLSTSSVNLMQHLFILKLCSSGERSGCDTSTSVILFAKRGMLLQWAMSSRRRHTLEPLKSLLLQLFSVVGVSDVDEGMCTLPDALAKEWCNAVLCDNVVSMCASRHNSSTLLDEGADLADALWRYRWHRQDGFAFAILADGSTAQEVHLAADTCARY